MNNMGVKPTDFVEIPVIDLARADHGPQAERALAVELRNAAVDVGFFYVVGHDVPQQTIDDAFAIAGQFFAWPLERKQETAVDRLHRGFLSVGGAKMSDKAKPDLKESFLFGIDLPPDDPDVVAGKPLMGPNRWPVDLPEMQIVVDRYASAVRACGNQILRLFAIALDLPPEHFVPLFAKPLARGSLLYYPPQPPAMGDDQFGVSAHTDYGALTFVCQGEIGGLQVHNRAGEWVEAPPLAGSFVVNIGDLMARWTNDVFVSTPHRVVNKSGRERYSIAYFFDPHIDAVIEAIPSCIPAGTPARYPRTTCGDHILGRFKDAFAYRKGALAS
jgi:isopenicillin N synthase-like dioxygenase